MKKTFIFLLAIVAMFVGCKRHPHVSDAAAKIDAVIVDKGIMQFYDMETQQLTPFTAESDSVVNMLFTDSTHLYYTAVKNDNLSLKVIDLGAKTIEPKLCANWNQTVDDVVDYEIGRVSDLYLSEGGKYLYIYGFDPDLGPMIPIAYSVSMGKVVKLDEEELFSLSYYSSKTVSSRFLSENHLFYYVTPQGKICLNDKINVSRCFHEAYGEDDIEFAPDSFSPDGQKVLFYAMMYWGENMGVYCVATVDGTSQYVLEDSNLGQCAPVWLPDGSLMYVGEEPRPQDDPAYEEDYNMTRPCVRVLDTKGNAKTLSTGSLIAARPFVVEKETTHQDGLENCDVAVFDKGKVMFYNSETGAFIPFVAESDSVINGVFDEMDCFFYTVAIGDNLYLKQVYMTNYSPSPVMLADWGLRLDDCVSETYGKAAELFWMADQQAVGIFHSFSWDFYNFSEVKLYDREKNAVVNDWISEMDESVDEGEEVSEVVEVPEQFVQTDEGFFYEVGDQSFCLSDKINFKDYCSDPEYFSDPEFVSLSIDPTHRFAAYYALIEWGDLGHGPLCRASLDGTMQTALKGTDAADLSWGWLKDGSLLYVGSEPRPTDDPDYDPEWNTTKPCIRILHVDGTDEVFSHALDFVTKASLIQ